MQTLKSARAFVGERDRFDELAEIISAYNAVTEKLERSHETLQGEVVRLQSELASTNARLQRTKRLAALGEMAAGIAHEIRNPLAAIQLYAKMLGDDLACETFDTGECISTANKIAKAVRGLNSIVNDVLNFAQEIRPSYSRVLIRDLFERAIDEHHSAIKSSHIEVTIVSPCNAEIECDGELLHRALLNLVRNAVEAMAGRPPSKLTLCSRVDGAFIRLSVCDTGPGIADDDIDRIFNPFFTTRHTGTGLGLAIVHRIVDAHGGTVSVMNGVAGGAVFELLLPLALEDSNSCGGVS